jgi:hypothetical protein
MRAKWNHAHGVTNVWREPPVHGKVRVKTEDGYLHANQKPLSLMERQVRASTNEGDVVWEPFGGLCSATLAASNLGRRAFASRSTQSSSKHSRALAPEQRQRPEGCCMSALEKAPTKAPEPSGGPPKAWQHKELYQRVVQTIYALPNHFETTLNIRRGPGNRPVHAEHAAGGQHRTVDGGLPQRPARAVGPDPEI